MYYQLSVEINICWIWNKDINWFRGFVKGRPKLVTSFKKPRHNCRPLKNWFTSIFGCQKKPQVLLASDSSFLSVLWYFHQCAPNLSTAALTNALWLQDMMAWKDIGYCRFWLTCIIFTVLISKGLLSFNEDRGHFYVLFVGSDRSSCSRPPTTFCT